MTSRLKRSAWLALLFLVAATFLGAQGIPVRPTQSGTITGVLRDSQGRPAAGIRVSAVSRPTSLEELGGGASMSSIAETDAQGRYTLENVPPGRYYIAAGRLDFPTYFPGTQAMGDGTLVTVAAGATVPGIDFVIRDSSGGRAEAGTAAAGTITIPLEIRVENNGKIPLFGDGKFTALRLTPIVPLGSPAATPTVVPLSQTALSLNVALPRYQVDIEGLPTGYALRSLQYGAASLSGGQLILLPVATATPATTPSQGGIANALNTLNNALSVGGGVQGTVQTLTINLSRTEATPRQGATVTGTLKTVEPRAIYISGTPGALYADGTFEFRDVREGGHDIVAVGNRATMPVLGAALIVGPGDMTGVELQQTAVPPAGFRRPSLPRAANGRTPGQVSLSSLSGRFIDSESGQPVPQGSIFLIGDDLWSERELHAGGTFEFTNLLPGRYEIEVHGVGYPTIRREVVIQEQAVVVELKGG